MGQRGPEECFLSPRHSPNGKARLSAKRLSSDSDVLASDADQTASDADQTASDRDQAASGEDALASDRDQQTADREHAAADGEPAAGEEAAAYARNRADREATAHDRDITSQLRETTAADREGPARGRDETARARDQAARLRDRTADARDREAHTHDNDEESRLRGSTDVGVVREQAARDRGRSTADRERAARDRERAARDREEAAKERVKAAQERAEAARDREYAAIDQLTGARVRGVGLGDLQREIDRAHRTGGSLVLAFVDVDNLKEVNDGEGHLAGDRLLSEVGAALRGALRSYDLITRFGGDEFLCAASGVRADKVKLRFDELAKQLADHGHGHSVTVGFAELQDGDDLQQLIARADNDLLDTRRP